MEHLVRIEVDLVLHDVVRRSCQLVSQRSDRHDAVRLGSFSLHELLGWLVVSHGEMESGENAHERYGLPFLELPEPFGFPLLSRFDFTKRQYDAKLPTLANRPISPTSYVMVSSKDFSDSPHGLKTNELGV